MIISNKTPEELGYNPEYFYRGLMNGLDVKQVYIDRYDDVQFKPGKLSELFTIHELIAYFDRDGVRYNLNNYIEYFNTKTKQLLIQSPDHIIKHFELILAHYHPIVRQVYEYMMGLNLNPDLYAMPGGGSNIQVFFGDSEGYIAILYLDNDDSKKFGHRKNYTLDINRKTVDNHFTKDKFNIPQVKPRLYKDFWAKVHKEYK